ncbi:hypothetical protein [Shewanella oncorhynchi]|uniref:hypothetical protein n=1 Tax=Shewanella oncorhynchi TaxID=2726434 RepID=UPI003D79C43D
MGLPVTVYRNTDAGAPVGMPTKPSDWLKILKACLVDGFGTKASLGWTLDFGSLAELKMVFRNSVADGGSGGAVQVEAHAGTDAVGQLVRFTPAKQITALDTYIEKMGYRCFATTSNSAYVTGWTVVGCGRAFYVMQEGVFNTLTTSFYNHQRRLWIGDLQSTIPNDQHIFTMVSGNGGGSAMTDSTNTTYQQADFCVSATTSVVCGVYASDGSGASATYGDANINIGGTPISTDIAGINVPILFHPLTVSLPSTDSVVLPSCKGIVPGLFHSRLSGFYGASTPISFTVDSVNYDVCYGRYAPHIYVQTNGEWYD